MKNTNYKPSLRRDENRGRQETEIGEIPQDWDIKSIASLTKTIVSGGTPSRRIKAYYKDGYIPWIKTQELSDNYIYDTEEKITDDAVKNSSARLVPKGTISIAMYGATVGKLGILGLDATTNQACCNMVLDESEISNLFLFYSLLSRRPDLINMASGAAQQNLNVGLIRNFKIALPEIVEQQQIASILSSLDDKIELNRRMNKTLEEMGKTLFKRWFVDFEFPCLLAYSERTLASYPELASYGYKSFGGLPAPEPNKYFVYVLELENGHHYIGMTDFILKRYHEHLTGSGAKYTLQHKPIKIVHWETFANKQEAAAREQWLKTGFGRKWLDREQKVGRLRQAGGEMVESELGLIPKGWEVGQINDFGVVVCGKTPPKSKSGYFGGNIPFIKIPDMHGKMFVTSSEDTLSNDGSAYQKNKLLPKDSICVSCIATVGLVCITLKESQTNQQINSIVLKENYYREYLYFSLSAMTKQLQDYASGGSATLNLNTGSFSNISILIPNSKPLGQFNESVSKLFEQILIINTIENENLSNIRDSLLPKLISGKLRV